jgi:hypothetical protein
LPPSAFTRRNSLFELLLLLPNLRSGDQGKQNTLVHWPSTSFQHSEQIHQGSMRNISDRQSNCAHCHINHNEFLLTTSEPPVISLWFTTLFLLYTAIQHNNRTSTPLKQRFTPDNLNATYNMFWQYRYTTPAAAPIEVARFQMTLYDGRGTSTSRDCCFHMSHRSCSTWTDNKATVRN